MKLYTSYYSCPHRRGFHNTFAISRSVPAYYTGKCYPPLAPEWSMIIPFKQQQIDEREYTRRYLELILNKRRLIPDQVIEALGNNAVLLCYEKSQDFCHRHIVATWLTTETGIVVEEIKKPITSLVDSAFEF